MIYGAAAPVVDAYEDLRQRVLQSLPLSGGLGLALLLDQGMYSWLQVCACHGKPADRSQLYPDLPRVPCEVESEVVLILASMAMHTPAQA